ncbi:MAG: DUF3108 domain-containing protein [Gammaproteobacteria bacterium]
MFRPLASLIFVLQIGWTGPVAAVEPFEAEYALSRGVLTLGRMTRRLDIDADDQYVLVSRMETTGLVSVFSANAVVEESRGRIVDQRLLPTAYRYDKKGTKRDYALHFDYARQLVARSDSGDWQADMPPGLLDKLSYQVQLMFDLDSVPRALDYPIADKGKLKQYLITNTGSEWVETPLGRFEAVRLERSDDNSARRTRVWCAQQLGWLPVKVEHRDKHGDVTVALLRRLDRRS